MEKRRTRHLLAATLVAGLASNSQHATSPEPSESTRIPVPSPRHPRNGILSRINAAATIAEVNTLLESARAFRRISPRTLRRAELFAQDRIAELERSAS